MIDIRGFVRKHSRILSGAALALTVVLIFWTVNNPAIIGASATTRQLPVYCVERSDKVVALSFDAAWGNEDTQMLIDILGKYNVKATFFVVGNYIQTSPDLVKRMAAEGHTVGNHTFHHPDMSKISDAASFGQEMRSLENLYKETTGQDMTKFYRPPQGKYSESNLKMAQELGYKTFFWSLAYVDWYVDKQPTATEAFNKLLTRIHPGAIVLLHSTSKTNSEILDELLGKWEAMGYTFGTLADLS